MIRFTDATILALTKLRARKIRTGITVGISGILFGLLVLVVVIAQGVFESVERFDDEGLNGRYVTTITKSGHDVFNIWDEQDDPTVLARIEVAHAALVAKKQTAAKKYSIEYNPKIEDPSPIIIDKATSKKQIDEKLFDSPVVLQVNEEMIKERFVPFAVNDYTKTYKSAAVLGNANTLSPEDGTVEYMKDGKEKLVLLTERQRQQEQYATDAKNLTLLPQTLAEPFVTNKLYNPESGELPVIIPYGDAEQLLGLNPLEKTAQNDTKLERIRTIRDRIGEVTVSFCYRNAASRALVGRAIAAKDEIAENKNNTSYKKPALIYAVPDATSCGAVAIESDTRTAAEKKEASNQLQYEKESGQYEGDPEQYKIILRGVGVSADAAGSGGMSSIADITLGLLSSSLGYGTWNIPQGLLEKAPQSARPPSIFNTSSASLSGGMVGYESYFVEFSDKQEARALLSKTGFFGAGGGSFGEVYAMPYGSGSLVMDELRTQFEKILFWVVLIVSVIAAIILSGMIGRTIADGRKETAVFRAIGARRGDIARIYVTYTLLLVLRIMIFTLILGLSIALIADAVVSRDATLGAQLAFAAVDESKEFHIIGLRSWYLYAILGVIVIIGLLSMIIPLLRNVRRSPINDMRDDS